ncbi:MAG: Ig-like domain-containing protein [Tannerellaceae bacterium]|nr:Ig-like domain-containing protein [Tannerellaceae bacterium]
MKTKILLTGCFLICLCFSGCKDEEKGITGISVTPAAVTALDLGETAQLTAVIAPADADEREIFWVSYDSTAVRVSGNGMAATVTALAPGTIAVFATTRNGVVVSNEVNVTVVPPDYAGLIIGEYTGTAIAMGMTLPNTMASLERVGDEKGIVKFTINANVQGFGTLVGMAETVALRETSPNQFSLQGEATLEMPMGMGTLGLDLTGTANATEGTLEVSMVAVPGSPVALTISYTGNRSAWSVFTEAGR